ncbi:MAG: cyclodeaminase/cyclohydrolase family protein, partial [Actinomycetota bacterium]|nr:cyclodeaminase/cyclohydrolase family protein [Actinomycetota bacterium]
MAGLGSRQVHEALADLASRAEPPAAGVASALTCAAAAALVELTAGLAAERVAAGELRAPASTPARLRALAGRAGELRERVLVAADEDVHAYAEVAKTPKGADSARALAEASEPPLEIAECA